MHQGARLSVVLVSKQTFPARNSVIARRPVRVRLRGPPPSAPRTLHRPLQNAVVHGRRPVRAHVSVRQTSVSRQNVRVQWMGVHVPWTAIVQRTTPLFMNGTSGRADATQELVGPGRARALRPKSGAPSRATVRPRRASSRCKSWKPQEGVAGVMSVMSSAYATGSADQIATVAVAYTIAADGKSACRTVTTAALELHVLPNARTARAHRCASTSPSARAI